MGFDQVIGHDRSINILQRSIENKAVSHSYLFEGEDGIGKKLVASIFAKTLLCKEKGINPCNKCSSCIKVNSGTHPDLIFIEPDNNMIRKNQVDEMIKNASKVPFESDKKIFIIDESHKMNVESKNAILKTLEEPASFVHIILISSNPENLLQTILSRVEDIKFFPVKTKEIEIMLKDKYNLKEAQATYIAKATKGAIGKSIMYAENELFFEVRDEAINIIQAILNKDLSKVFSSADFFEENKNNIEDILDMYVYWFRDILIYKELGYVDLIINVDKIDILEEQTYLTIDRINQIIECIEETKNNLKKNINFQLAIEVMLLNIGGK